MTFDVIIRWTLWIGALTCRRRLVVVVFVYLFWMWRNEKLFTGSKIVALMVSEWEAMVKEFGFERVKVSASFSSPAGLVNYFLVL